jgi:hypothetical protein
MAIIKAYGSLFRDWESLIASCAENADALPDVGSLSAPLADLLTEARGAKNRQENLEGERRATTQALRDLSDRGKDAARQLRALVKARLGPKSERLKQFGIAPLRGRSRPATVKPPTEPPPPIEDGKPTSQ